MLEVRPHIVLLAASAPLISSTARDWRYKGLLFSSVMKEMAKTRLYCTYQRGRKAFGFSFLWGLKAGNSSSYRGNIFELPM